MRVVEIRIKQIAVWIMGFRIIVFLPKVKQDELIRQWRSAEDPSVRYLPARRSSSGAHAHAHAPAYRRRNMPITSGSGRYFTTFDRRAGKDTRNPHAQAPKLLFYSPTKRYMTICSCYTRLVRLLRLVSDAYRRRLEVMSFDCAPHEITRCAQGLCERAP